VAVEAAERDLLVQEDVWEDTVRVYAHSQASASTYATVLSAMKTAITSLQTACDTYKANRVTDAEGLLKFLEGEKLSALLFALRHCRFESLAPSDLSSLSSEAAIEELMSELAEDLSDGDEFIHVSSGDTMLSDYTERPRMPLYEPEDPDGED
jgi:hypothetical protein